ncbi:MAG: PAS domain S-box protein [Nitrospiraceae bacterium]
MNGTIFTPKTRPTGQGFAFAELWRWAGGLFPKGQVLPDLVWRQRHRWLIGLLLLHAIGLPVMGLLAGQTIGWSAAAGLILASLAGMATWSRISRVIRAALVTTGLITAGVILVHFSNGRIEAHFHFFVIIAFIATYHDWRPFLLALGLIVLHHGVMGTLEPAAVYNHPHAMAHPWVWAAIHGGGILAESLGLLLYWKFNETATAQLRKSERQFQLVVESAPHGLLMVNQAGVMVMVNAQIERVGGYQRQELLGQPMEILIPERFKPDFQRAFVHALSTHVMESHCNVSFRRKDGTEFPVELGLNSIETPNGLHLLASVIGITEHRQAAENIAQTTERLEIASSTLQTGIWDWNIAKNELVWNDRMFDLYGVQKDEFTGAYDGWLSHVHFDDRARFEEAVQHALLKGQPYAIEFRIRRPDGSVRVIKAAGQILRDMDGTPLRMTGINYDVTESRQAEQALRESEERYRLMIEEITDYAILTLDREGKVASWNSGARRLKQYEEAEIIGRHFSCFYMPEAIAQGHPARLLQQASLQGRAEDEGWRVRKDDSRFWADVTITALHDETGAIRGFSKVTRDITARKQTESRMEQSAMEMECKNLQLEVAHDLAQTATEAKSRFLASMSHEIRTPMNAIVGMADLLAETPLTKEQEDYVNRFSRAANHLLELINDILDFSKIEAEQLELEAIDFNLPELVESTAELMAIRAHAKGLELMTNIGMNVPETVTGDPTHLRQILVNLIGNAIKFTEHGEIVIRIESAEPRLVRFEISDTGIGIPENKARSIFENFTQVDYSTTRKYGGTGLGLSISKRLTELMGSEIEVNSLLGLGSTFGFTIMFPAATAATTDPFAAFPALQGLRLLVVDDHETNRSVIGAILSKGGAFVTACENGPDALALMQHASAAGEPVQLAIIDRQMPSMDGLQVVEAMRQATELAGIPVLMLTSGMYKDDSEHARRLQIKGTVSKPISRAALLIAAAAAIASPATDAGASLLPAVPLPPIPDLTRPLRILLAEDLEDNRDVVALFLNKTPWSLEFAANGAVAVAKFKAGQYDLVLMDMQMPVLDGYQATAAIRRWEQEHQRTPTPIVALTANVFAEELNESLASGCTAYLTKPIKKQMLLKAIREHTQQPMDHAA